MDALLESIGAKVRVSRQARGWTIKALAERSGVSVRFLIELEKGRGNISVGRLALVASALAVPLATFFLSPRVAVLAAQMEEIAKEREKDKEQARIASDHIKYQVLPASRRISSHLVASRRISSHLVASRPTPSWISPPSRCAALGSDRARA